MSKKSHLHYLQSYIVKGEKHLLKSYIFHPGVVIFLQNNLFRGLPHILFPVFGG